MNQTQQGGNGNRIGATGAPLLVLKKLDKRFGATHALKAVDLEFEAGEVHALVGENGAGKSTLGRIIAGVMAPDAGEVRVAGRAVQFRSPRDALDRGITTIAQEISLVPSRSVIENVFLGIEDNVLGVVRTAATPSEVAASSTLAQAVEKSTINRAAAESNPTRT
jgi:ABC-type sugar transport system ATPase subunit